MPKWGRAGLTGAENQRGFLRFRSDAWLGGLASRQSPAEGQSCESTDKVETAVAEDLEPTNDDAKPFIGTRFRASSCGPCGMVYPLRSGELMGVST